MSLDIRHLTPNDIALMEALLTTFGAAFNDMDTYTTSRPSADYLRQLLGGDSFIALAALKNGEVIGGIAAYELRKFEQERSEIYIYDLAVAETATGVINIPRICWFQATPIWGYLQRLPMPSAVTDDSPLALIWLIS